MPVYNIKTNAKIHKYIFYFCINNIYLPQFPDLAIISVSVSGVVRVWRLVGIPSIGGGIRDCHRDGQCHQNKKQQHAQEVHCSWWYFTKPETNIFRTRQTNEIELFNMLTYVHLLTTLDLLFKRMCFLMILKRLDYKYDLPVDFVESEVVFWSFQLSYIPIC